LEGCKQNEWRGASRGLAGEVVERLIRLIATVSPGAKLGSTAPHSYASAVLVEAGDEQPRTLANAFLKPVAERGDLLANTYSAAAEHLRDLDAMYGTQVARKLAACGPAELWGVERASLPEVAAWTRAQIHGG
jgi:CRISPR system Cascade subunit CasC